MTNKDAAEIIMLRKLWVACSRCEGSGCVERSCTCDHCEGAGFIMDVDVQTAYMILNIPLLPKPLTPIETTLQKAVELVTATTANLIGWGPEKSDGTQ